jgi:hypothetical protein
MATVAQFDFLVRASTDLAVQKLGKLAEAAAKATGEIEGVESVDLAAWGGSALNAAGRAAGGMLDLAKSASAVVEQANFVDQVFKDAAPSIKKWAETADQTALLSESAALKAAAYLGVFGQAIDLTGEDLAGFSTRLVELAADLASVADTSVDDAVTAIGAALRNEYEPMRKYGIVLNDAVLKKTLFDITGQKIAGTLTQEQKILAVNETLFQKLGFAIGDVERTFGGFANQSRYLDAQMENFKAQIGEGVRPAFIALFGAANSVLSVLGNMPPVVAEVGGKLAMAATGVLGIAGSLAIVTAKAPAVIETFKKMSTTMNNMATGSSRLGKGLVGIGAAGAAIAATAVAADLFVTALNSVRHTAEKTSNALQDIGKANMTDNLEEAYAAFLKLAKIEDDAAGWKNLWEDWGNEMQLAGSDFSLGIEEADAAFQKMLDMDPGATANVLDYMKLQNAELDHSSTQYKENADRIAVWEEKLSRSVTAAQMQGDVTAFTTAQLEKYGDGALAAAAASEETAKAAEEHAEAVEKMSEKYAEASDKIDEISDKFADSKAAAEAFEDVIGETMGTNAFVDNIIDMRDATESMFKAFKDEDGNLNGMLMGFDTWNESGRENVQNVEALADAVGTDLMMAFKDSGGSLGVVIDRQKDLQAEFEATARAAGIPEEKIKELSDQIYATPEELTIAVRLAGQEEARQKLDMLNLDLSMLPPAKRIQFMAAIDRGDFQAAWGIAEETINAEGPLNAELAVENADLGPVLADAQGQIDKAPDPYAWLHVKPTSPKPAKDEMQGELRIIGPLLSETVSKATSTAGTKRDMQGDLVKSGDLIIKASSKETPTSPTRRFMQADLSSQPPLTVDTKATPGDTGSARWVMQNENNQHPLSTQTHAKAGDTGSARWAMQSDMNKNPLSITVNPVISNAWRNTVREMENAFLGVGRSAPGGGGSGAAAPTPYGSVYVPSRVVAGQQAAQMTPSVVNISMIMPVGADETRIVSALKRYTNNYGALPLKIAQMQVG